MHVSGAPDAAAEAATRSRRDSLKTGHFRGFARLEAFQIGDFQGFLL